jgi:Rad3-related DNA helicase
MWSLYEDEKELKPLIFSNGKSQADVVKEVIEGVNQGHKIIFIRGMMGTGKSAIALNLARKFGKTSIVVPIKSLQEQYIKDYSENKYVLLNGKKLTIQPILGRQNFKCKYLEEDEIKGLEKYSKERDANLFETLQERSRPNKAKTDTCDNNYLPCKIEIKEKNLSILKEYIKKNPAVKLSNFDSVEDIKRITIAPVCEYWSPIVAEEFETKRFKDAIKKQYTGINKKKYAFYQRKSGCPYYNQYNAYIDADVIIFNSLKYKIESMMGRKPATNIEIIDECDEFLDSFAEQEQINISRLQFSLNMLFSPDPKIKETIDKLIDITNAIKVSEKLKESDEIHELNNTLVQELLETVLENPDLLDLIESDDHNYLFHLDKAAKKFYDFMDETFFSVEKRENDKIITLVTTNLDKQLKTMVDNNKVVVMMSGTIHSETVLKNIFGLDTFKVIEAEIEHQGELIKCKHGYEVDCSYESFRSKRVTRETYLKALSKSISCAKSPTLVHVNSFSDLPTDQEKALFSLDNLPTQIELIEEQNNDPTAKRVREFRDKKTKILFTTKCNRGVDFPGDICNSIVITRFPYPNISSIFWKILKRNKPQHFMSFYMDKSRRELMQKVYRGLRSKTDKVYLLSPDKRVLDFNFDRDPKK